MLLQEYPSQKTDTCSNLMETTTSDLTRERTLIPTITRDECNFRPPPFQVITQYRITAPANTPSKLEALKTYTPQSLIESILWTLDLQKRLIIMITQTRFNNKINKQVAIFKITINHYKKAKVLIPRIINTNQYPIPSELFTLKTLKVNIFLNTPNTNTILWIKKSYSWNKATWLWKNQYLRKKSDFNNISHNSIHKSIFLKINSFGNNKKWIELLLLLINTLDEDVLGLFSFV